MMAYLFQYPVNWVSTPENAGVIIPDEVIGVL